MQARDIYIKTTNAKGSVVSQHRVWDADKFMAAQHEQAAKDSKKDPASAYSVSLSTEAEYKKGRKQ